MRPADTWQTVKSEPGVPSRRRPGVPCRVQVWRALKKAACLALQSASLACPQEEVGSLSCPAECKSGVPSRRQSGAPSTNHNLACPVECSLPCPRKRKRPGVPSRRPRPCPRSLARRNTGQPLTHQGSRPGVPSRRRQDAPAALPPTTNVHNSKHHPHPSISPSLAHGFFPAAATARRLLLSVTSPQSSAPWRLQVWEI